MKIILSSILNHQFIHNWKTAEQEIIWFSCMIDHTSKYCTVQNVINYSYFQSYQSVAFCIRLQFEPISGIGLMFKWQHVKQINTVCICYSLFMQSEPRDSSRSYPAEQCKQLAIGQNFDCSQFYSNSAGMAAILRERRSGNASANTVRVQRQDEWRAVICMCSARSFFLQSPQMNAFFKTISTLVFEVATLNSGLDAHSPKRRCGRMTSLVTEEAVRLTDLTDRKLTNWPTMTTSSRFCRWLSGFIR